MKIYKFLLSGLCSLVLLGCEKIIELDVPYEQPSLVVNGFLNPDSSLSVHLSKSQFILDNAELEVVSGATIQVFEGAELLGLMEPGSNGFYRLEGHKPKVGVAYSLEVAAEGMEAVQVQETTVAQIKPEVHQLDSIKKVTEWGGDIMEYEIDISIPDPANSRNFYMLKVFQRMEGHNWSGQDEEPEEFIYLSEMNLESPDPASEPFCFQGCGLLLSDEFFDGKNYRMKLKASSYSSYVPPAPGEERKLVFALYHLSESSHRYYKSVELNRNTEGDPFAEPVKVFTNVAGGFGILGAITPTYVELPR